MSQGIYLILQGVVSVKYKDREIETRGPNQYLGDECIAEVSSVYNYECTTNVICLFIEYSTFSDNLRFKSKTYLELKKVSKQSRKNLRFKALDLFKEEYEANILNQANLIGEFIEEFNLDKLNNENKLRKDKTKIKSTNVEQSSPTPPPEKESQNSAAGSQRLVLKTPSISMNNQPDQNSILPSLFKSIRHPETYKKGSDHEEQPQSDLVLKETESSFFESQFELENQEDEDDLEKAGAIATEDIDLNITVDDSFLMADPVASMASSDLSVQLEASLDMAEVR